MNFETRDIFGFRLEIDPASGSSVYALIELALKMLKPFENFTSSQSYVRFKFNGVLMEVTPKSKAEDLAEYYINALKKSK